MKFSVITDDKIMILDGVPLVFDFAVDSNIHALHWHGTHGKIERKQGEGAHFESMAEVQPFIDLYHAEAARLAAIAATPPTAEELTAKNNATVEVNLTQLDLKSIRAMREYIASKADAPQILKDRESAAQAERAKFK